MASDVRTKLRTAIISRYKADTTHAFYTGTGGRLTYVSAPSGQSLPFAVFTFIGCDPDDTFTERADDVLLQISVWAATSAAAETLASAAADLFEGHRFTAAGIGDVELYRTGVVPTMDESDAGVSLWQSGIELSCTVQTI